jgi:MoxR-like ATPase
MVWERLLPDAPLRRLLLVQPEAAQNAISFLAQPLTVDTRVVSHLLGDAAPDERIKRALMLPEMTASTDPLQHLPEALVEPMYAALHSNQMLYLQGTPGVGRADTARALCAHLGLALVVIDLEALKALDTAGTLSLAQGWRLALREATLTGAAANGSSQNGAALLLDNWESALNEATQQPPADLWDALTVYPYPVILCGKSSWESHADAQRSRRLMRFTFPMPEYPQRQRLWAAALSDNGNPAGLNTDELARKFRFTPAQIRRAVRTALDIAASRGEAQVTTDDLYAGAQAHSRLRLGHLAKQITPRHTWDDLVLPADRLTQLRELRDWAEHTYLVQETWGFGRKGAPVSGVNALFAGESGTGKTMSAEVIAADLGLVLYKIDLSAVVSKYIGETEKNLSVIFEEARASSAILFFDEADALFGKRAEVKDARDRYANIETAYLLQQVEEYDGIVILATNLRQNLDEAFTRRLDFLIDYPFPEPEYRKRIWQVHLPPQAPVAGDVDLDYLAEKYAMAGGNIRNAALASAFLAAADGKVITMQHLQHAIRREHQKMGRLVKG